MDVDNHPLESDICRRWLVSDAGRLAKIENPMGYKNVLLHMKMHKDMEMQKQMQDAMQQMQAQQGMMPPAGPAEQGGPAQQPPEQNSGVQMNEGQYAPTVQ